MSKNTIPPRPKGSHMRFAQIKWDLYYLDDEKFEEQYRGASKKEVEDYYLATYGEEVDRNNPPVDSEQPPVDDEVEKRIGFMPPVEDDEHPTQAALDAIKDKMHWMKFKKLFGMTKSDYIKKYNLS